MAKHFIDDFHLNTARGLTQGTTAVHRIGYNPDIDTATDPETVWSHGGLYPWSAFDTAGTLSVVSTSASDTSPVILVGLDANMVQQTETITLTGTTPVVTTKQWKRIFDVMVTTTVNVGEIDVSKNGSIVCCMLAGEGRSSCATYTIPAGKTGYLYCGDCSVNLNKEVTIKFYIRQPGGAFIIAHIIELVGNSFYRYDFPFPQAMPAGTDLEVRVDNANDNNCRVSANFDLILIDTPITTIAGTGIPDVVTFPL